MDLLQSDRVQKEASVNWLMLLGSPLPSPCPFWRSLTQEPSQGGARVSRGLPALPGPRACVSLTRTTCPTEQVRQLERSIGLKDLAMAEMEEKIRNMEASTYDGVFIWKITEFARKRQEAITGRSPAIFSPGVQSPQNLLHLSCVWVSWQDLCLGHAARLRKEIVHVEGGVLSWRVKHAEQCC